MTDPKHDIDEIEEEIIYVSKEELKRDLAEMRELANRLVEMSQTKLDKLTLTPAQIDAVALGKKIKNKKDAYHRHLQFFTKLLHNKDLSALYLGLEKIKQGPLLANQHIQKLEALSLKIIAEGDPAIQSLLNEHADLDRSKLRQFARQAKKDQAAEKPSKAAKQLLQYLRSMIPQQ
ncbi:ribosome biogenesis factor YjgA [Algibacillus agarilyticus]|uniref:ribosome biogenesis factor YjgA n=1 Tax=Algibacillus agarilyticus TaxID=2234133 RepID=UPI000DCFD40D|nr:ribosome biogenesis factor YjgA [Algibacillus agarilyticus]